MKKIINLKFATITVLILCCVLFVGCSENLSNLVKENMSDLRINYFEGKTELFYADLSCGYREQNFAYDGVSTKKTECGVLSVEFKKTYSYLSICVNLDIDGDTKEYVLLKSPFENKYMIDIEKIVNEKNAIKLSLKNQDDYCDLINVSKDWKIQYEDALNIGIETFKEELKNEYSNGKFNAEGYLKVVSKNEFDQKFWYFSFITTKNVSKSMLINVNSGKQIKNTI